MILVCPKCKASYLISTSAFADGARTVRCVRCSTSWVANVNPYGSGAKNEAMSTAETGAPEAAQNHQNKAKAKEAAKEAAQNASGAVKMTRTLPPAPRKPISWTRVRDGVSFAMGVLAIIGFVWFLATSPLLGKVGHGLKRVSDALGLTKPATGEGLSLQNIRSERRFLDGAMQLVIDGDVRNDTKETRVVPDINVNALGPDKKVVLTWRIDAPAVTLSPGALAPFRSSSVMPTGTVMEVNLSFVEPRHDPAP